jgi:hypothetical protein
MESFILRAWKPAASNWKRPEVKSAQEPRRDEAGWQLPGNSRKKALLGLGFRRPLKTPGK